MEVALLFVLGLGLIAAGVGMTTLLATRLPMDVLVTAQAHGRFAGLGSNQESDWTRSPVAYGCSRRRTRLRLMAACIWRRA